MGKSRALRVQEMRAIIRLANDCRDLGDDFAAWLEHYSSSLSRLTGAGMCASGVLEYAEGKVQVLSGVHWGWQNGFDRRHWEWAMAEYGGQVQVSPMIASYFLRADGADGAGLTRPDLLSDRDWYTSLYSKSIHGPIGIDHTLASFLKLPGRPELSIGIALGRSRAERHDFSLRARALLAEAQSVVLPLFGGALAGHEEPSPSCLPPRTRQVLRCLLEGDGDKQIAARLKMSQFTANGHTKAIFAHFGVCGRAELLARWVRRGWGRRFAWSE